MIAQPAPPATAQTVSAGKSDAEAGRLSHFDAAGQAHMVDVGGKAASRRRARATGSIRMQPDAYRQIKAGTIGKGDVLGIARIAGIQGAKRTAELIPLCHPLPLSHVALDFALDDAACRITVCAHCECTGRTGVEMEALTAVSIALLTLYDMCKAIDRGMVIENIRLQEKAGGKSGHWRAIDFEP